MIAESARILPDVKLGKDVYVGDYCVLGIAGAAQQRGIHETRVEDGAVLRSHTVIYAGTTIGEKTQIGHGVLVREMTTVGANASIGSHTVVEHHVQIEDGVRIHSQAFVPEYSILRRGAWLGPSVVLTNARFPLGRDSKKWLEGVEVGEDAILCANCTILPGVRVGNRALIGAGAVVVQDVPDEAVVVGNPARPLKTIHELRYRDGSSPY